MRWKCTPLSVTWVSSAAISDRGLSQACGTFVFPDAISTDPADIDGYLVSAIGKTGSIWDVESALRGGFSKLRDDGLQVEEETLEVGAEEGFAYLVATRIANQVWQESMGIHQRMVHYIPRNEEQRDLLLGSRRLRGQPILVETLGGGYCDSSAHKPTAARSRLWSGFSLHSASHLEPVGLG